MIDAPDRCVEWVSIKRKISKSSPPILKGSNDFVVIRVKAVVFLGLL
jgi:hypothetical protein